MCLFFCIQIKNRGSTRVLFVMLVWPHCSLLEPNVYMHKYVWKVCTEENIVCLPEVCDESIGEKYHENRDKSVVEQQIRNREQNTQEHDEFIFNAH